MDMEILHTENEKEQEVVNTFIQPGPGPPHEVMFLILGYLPLFELLTMTEVCKSLKDALDNDILPWLNLFVEKPLNSRVSDHILLKITSKANGRLKSLGLIDCRTITDDGLQAITANNPLINKLYVPGCTSLTADGIIRVIQMLPEHSRERLCVHINGIYNINKEHLDTLRDLIQVKETQREQRKRLYNFFHKRHKYFLTFRHKKETFPSIDIDICPRCNEVRMVFDCPQQTCRRKEEQLTECRGCNLCIPRCEECGRCVIDIEEHDDFETACADILCMECWLQLPKCNYCNKPYCNQHAHLQHSLPDFSGFVCEVCNSNFTEASSTRIV